MEDGGLFLYSYHSTDPASDKLVNSFDLVRIHLFGHHDGDKEYETPTKYPSFKQMVDRYSVDPEVLAQYTDFSKVFEDLPTTSPTTRPSTIPTLKTFSAASRSARRRRSNG